MSSTPSRSSKAPVALALLMIGVGAGWLLTELQFGPRINWTWTAVLIVTGVLAFVLSGGLDKVSVVLGPFLIVGGLLSIARQTGALGENVEMPVLVIVAGCLFLFAQSSRVPLPRWYDVSPPRT